nr:retrovirus-related Pol polyprotein from transposon TNT 1-94 [Tanacetum cinerariifolium]
MKMFLAMVKREFNKHVKIVRSDNGTEFTCMKHFFLDERIIFQTSCVVTPQQNGRVERKHRHILNVGRALRFQSSLPIDFWGECILTAAYLINRTPSSILKGKTPYTVLHNVEPPYNHLRKFGCLCYAHIKTGDKFSSRSRKCVFVGYPYGQKEFIIPSVNDNEYNGTEIHEETPSQDRGEDNLGRGHRKKETSVRLRDYVTNTIKKKCPSRFTPPAQSRSSEPVTYHKAIKDKRWRSAMDSELEALERNQTWTIEELPSNKKALGCKWVCKIKYKSDETIERSKARLVILGNHQVERIDYNETFAPVSKMVTVRVLLAITAFKQWELHQMDVHNAFLRGNLEEEVFMKLPLGLNMGTLKYFLGVEVARAQDGIFLCQWKYALEIICEAGLLGAKPLKIPMKQNYRLGLAKGCLFENPEQYRRLVAAIRVVRFLKGSPGQGILLKSKCDLQLRGWYDADWACFPLTRRSLTGWLVYLGDSPVSWKTKKQHTVLRSSAEVEYRFMVLTTGELKWLKGILKSLGIDHPQQMLLYCDSQAAMHISRNSVFHERTKHIEVDFHYIRDEIVCRNLDARHVPTKEQVAYFFTKALDKVQFDYLLCKLGVQNFYIPT